jgi:hypothetical protein
MKRWRDVPLNGYASILQRRSGIGGVDSYGVSHPPATEP